MSLRIVQGNLIDEMLSARYEVAIQGCNCMSIQGAGLAAQMVTYFSTNSATYFKMESRLNTERWFHRPENKLGCIDYGEFYVNGTRALFIDELTRGRKDEPVVTIVNCYTQIAPGIPGKYGIPLDYDALTLCLRKINLIFEGRTIAIPYLIGCGLAQGDEHKVLNIIDNELVDCKPTLIRL